MTAARQQRRSLNIWPGFVDATASLLMVVVFALLFTIIGHLVLSTALSSRDEALAKFKSRVSQLTEMLSMEQAEAAKLRQRLSVKTANLDGANNQLSLQRQTIQDKEKLLAARDAIITDHQNTIATQTEMIKTLGIEIKALIALRDRIKQDLTKEIAAHDVVKQRLQEESALNIKSLAQMELLNRQLEELRQQFAALSNALEIAEKNIADKQTTIDDLGSRLNTALAKKAQKLQKYRSEFFGRLREALSQYPNIRIDGDRFIFPSELLFESGSDKLGRDGVQQVKQLAKTLAEIAKIIPDDIDWILRIDGHTDKRPIVNSPYFQSNWELSSARAISIIREMINNGIPANRMVAAGFAEYHPVATANTPEAYARNRRIELKLSSR